MKSVISMVRRKKIAEATHNSGMLSGAKWIALGSGGCDSNNQVIAPLAENIGLNNEIIRKKYDSYEKITDTKFEYKILLEPDELVGEFISEIALIDSDGDVIAFASFTPKGKDDTEMVFIIEMNY